MKHLQIGMAVATMLLAALNAVVVHVWWVPDNHSAVAFALIDGPMLLVVLAGLVAIAIAKTRRYELNIALLAVTALAVACSLLVVFGDPLALLVAVSLLLTTIVSGIRMNRGWRREADHGTI